MALLAVLVTGCGNERGVHRNGQGISRAYELVFRELLAADTSRAPQIRGYCLAIDSPTGVRDPDERVMHALAQVTPRVWPFSECRKGVPSADLVAHDTVSLSLGEPSALGPSSIAIDGSYYRGSTDAHKLRCFLELRSGTWALRHCELIWVS